MKITPGKMFPWDFKLVNTQNSNYYNFSGVLNISGIGLFLQVDILSKWVITDYRCEAGIIDSVDTTH